mmetsp:Transcript_4460/g.12519  ORF Transcript_4460/g.12519 Transcript_4460/m.12519 type:complete len:345 (+) Transcript_4460:47-1081(+)
MSAPPLSCLLCLSGLPAAGKSSLAARMATDPDPIARALGLPDDAAVQVVHVSYDDLELIERASRVPGCGFDAAAWRSAREEAARRARAAFAERPEGHAVVVILDDNMQYRSMRKQACRLARACDAAFVHVHVHAPLAVALERNSARPAATRVPEHLLREMATNMEVPSAETAEGAGRQGWERPFIAVDTARDDGSAGADEPWTTILDPCALVAQWREKQPSPPSDPAMALEEAQESRQQTLASVNHQLDLRLRKTVGNMMAARAMATVAEKKDLASRLNAMRKEALMRATTGPRHHHGPPAGAPAPAAQASVTSEHVEELVDENHTLFVLECRALLSGLSPAPA